LTDKKIAVLAGLFIVIWAYPIWASEENQSAVTRIEIPSSFNPVGSGARAMGMGGAFIAVADDATAASWNPGGLVQLRLPEFSIVTSGIHRKEDIDFEINHESAGSHSISETNINYLSATYPFGFFRRNMIVSLSWQRLYDFTRRWDFFLERPELNAEDHWDYEESGSLSALGLALGVQIVPQLSLGFTLNLWDDDLTGNKWEKQYRQTRLSNMGAPPARFDKEETYSFSGINANIGVLWRINHRMTLGAVLKTPFKADIRREVRETQTYEIPPEPVSISETSVKDEEIEMPISYGIGIAYKFSDHFLMSADFYRTEWDDFVYKYENGEERNPVSAEYSDQSDVSPTHQMRLGAEYRFMNPAKGYVIPLRAGLFYDPAPARENPDDFYGFSLGLGFTGNDRFSLDMAYQYRTGSDVGTSVMETLGFSQDTREHTIYLSFILYL